MVCVENSRENQTNYSNYILTFIRSAYLKYQHLAYLKS